MKKYLFLISLFLWTCGGGDSDDPTDTSSSIISQPHYVEAYETKTFELIATSSNGEVISFSIDSTPSNGQATINSNQLTYSPNNGFYGTEVFSVNAN